MLKGKLYNNSKTISKKNSNLIIKKAIIKHIMTYNKRPLVFNQSIIHAIPKLTLYIFIILIIKINNNTL